MKKFLLLSSPVASLFAQEGDAVSGGNLSQLIIMIGIALVFFYFILYRPEQKRRKKAEAMRSSLKKGDKVTAMGIVGTVYKIKDNTVVIKTGEDAKIEMLKGAITDVMAVSPESEATPAES